tara:strand:- start:118 stop:306 length:189 start_codon:yes stop_codon:yes gene_type:complete
MDREIAKDYINYRIGQGYTLLQIAQLHDIPPKYSRNCYTEKHVVDTIADDIIRVKYESFNKI